MIRSRLFALTAFCLITNVPAKFDIGKLMKMVFTYLNINEGGQWDLTICVNQINDHGISSRHFMANRWGNRGNSDVIFSGSKITADSDCSHEIKRHLLLGRKAMANLNNILKNGDVTLPTKVRLVKALVFPVVMYGCESWTIKKTEHWRIHTFELWCWRRLLRVSWAAGRASQSILKDISPEYSLEGLMLKLQSFGHLKWRTDSLEKTLMLGKIEGRRRMGWRRMDERVRLHHQFDGHEFEQALGVGNGQGILACYSLRDHKESDTTEWLNWTDPPFWYHTE